MPRLRRLLRLLREYDPKELLWLVSQHAPRSLFHFDTFAVTRLAGDPTPVRHPTGAVVRRVKREELPQLAFIFPTGLAELQRRFSHGDIGLVCEVGSEITGVLWIGVGALRDEAHQFCSFEVPPDVTWTYDLAVVGQWRMRGVFPLLIHHAQEYAAVHGSPNICGYTSAYNGTALRSFLTLGFQTLLRVTVVNVLGVRVHRIASTDSSVTGKIRIGLLSKPRISLATSARAPAVALSSG